MTQTFLKHQFKLTAILLSLLLCGIGSMKAQEVFAGENQSGDWEFVSTSTGDLETPIGYWEPSVWSLRTNGIAWLATIPNIAGEFRVSDHFALDLGFWYCPWKISNRYSLKVFAILPEVRYWLSKECYGHFFNVHLTSAWFNLRWKESRYQDSGRPLLGAGIGYGYMFRFNENWGLELSLGVGYFNMRYDTFYNLENGAYIDTRVTSYWGLDRLGVTLVYNFTL